MYWNYIKIAIRNLLLNKSDTLINILGLSIGIAATILILLYNQFELSFDKFHHQSGRIYRISVQHVREGQIDYDSHFFTPPIGPDMKENFPEVENFVRLREPRTFYFSYNNSPLRITQIQYTDSTFFDIFSFSLLVGNPKNVLASPYSIVLTENSAKRIFGRENPLGKQIKSENKRSYTVTGVVANPPANSHIQFNALISFSSLYFDPTLYMGWDGGNQYVTYLKLGPGVVPEHIDQKLPDFMWERINKKYATVNARLEPYLQALTDIHLKYNPYSQSLCTNLSIFGLIALMILIIACINFVNLATARSSRRAKEIGVRKVVGATVENLRLQLLLESLILSFLAVVLALILVELFFPFYTRLLGRNLNSFSLLNPKHLGGVIVIVLTVGLLAGSYPSFYLASFPVVTTMKGLFKKGYSKSKFRNTLVILQFTISISLIIFTILINQQINFIRNKELGFQKQNIIVLPLTTDEIKIQSALIKQKISSLADVVSVSASSDIPYRGFTSNGYFPEGYSTPLMINVVDIDENFLETFNINLISGRNFSASRPADQNNYLINQALADHLGWEDPLGRLITRNGDHQVIGMVKDFNFASLHNKLQPLILTNRPWLDQFNYLSVRYHGEDSAEILKNIEQIWRKNVSTAPFEYMFLNEAFNQLYTTEQRLEQIFLYFSILAVIIASLGLYSLTAFIGLQRRKEIVIRKVLGATTSGLTHLLTSEYMKLVLMANIIAWPITWYVMHTWIANYAYRIDISLWIFLLAGGIAFLIALITISFQAIRAALTNPTEVLRYE